jgi:ferredoxin-NADP reductase
LTLPILDVRPAIPRARVVRIDLQGQTFRFEAGQALLVAASGQTLRRPYSIAVSPEDVARDGWLELLVGVDLEGRPGPHLQLEPGALVDVEGPVGRFTFPAQPAVSRFLFVAGGTGIAPLRAMLRHALGRGFSRVSLLYSARTPGDFAFEDELRLMAAERQIELRLTVTRDAGNGDSGWSGARGRIGTELLAPLIHDRATLCFVCGPRALVNDIPQLLTQLGVSPSAIRLEEW